MIVFLFAWYIQWSRIKELNGGLFSVTTRMPLYDARAITDDAENSISDKHNRACGAKNGEKTVRS